MKTLLTIDSQIKQIYQHYALPEKKNCIHHVEDLTTIPRPRFYHDPLEILKIFHLFALIQG